MLAAKRLTELPQDIILHVFQWLDVKAIARVQSTCRLFRDLCLSRSLWLQKLQDADQTCSPSIPPHLSVDALSDLELREVLVAPARSCDQFLRGEVRYGNRRTIALPPLYAKPTLESTHFFTETMRLTPGGRYLVASSVEVLHIIDVHGGGKCIWTRTAQTVFSSDPRRRPIDIGAHAVEMCSDGSLNLLLLYKFRDARNDFLVEVHQITPGSTRRPQRDPRPAFAKQYFTRHDDTPCIQGNYIVLPGEGFMTVTNWQTSQTIEIDLPDLFSMTEQLRPEVWNGHVFFIMRTFYAIQHRKYDYQITTFRLSSLFDGSESLPSDGSKVNIALQDVDSSTIHLPHSQDHTLVSISRLMVSDLSWKNYKDRSLDGAVANIAVGGKFWEASGDTIRNFFSVYSVQFDPSLPSADRFTLKANPTPQNHPFEESNFLIAYASASPSFTHCQRGFLTHTIAQSHLRLQFRLSVTGLDEKGELHFAGVNKEFEEYLRKNWHKMRVPVEEHTGALLLLSVDTSSVDIWYPV